jgi:type I restriction enzyme S subunit
MLPYKGGITASEGVPRNGKITKFSSGDILISNIRTYFEKIWYARFDGGCSTDVLAIRANEGIIQQFLYYYLSQDSFFEYTVRTSKGTKMPRGDKNAIMNFLTNVPPPEEQKAITKILSDLDSKIELNQQMNKTLESIAQSIFKHWFIDFEFPNEQGKPYRSSGGEIVDSELGKIPDGWTVKKLGEVGSFKNGVNYVKGENGDGEFYITNVRDISNGKFLLKESLDRVKLDINKAREYLLDDKDIIIARSACPGEVSLIVDGSNDVIYSGFSIRFRSNVPNNWMYMFLTFRHLKKQLITFSIGTTLTSVNQQTLKNMKFVLPSDIVMKNFNITIDSIFNRVFSNSVESLMLSRTRDSLLPRLMSGMIRVPLES